jgi:hypothetical protein
MKMIPVLYEYDGIIMLCSNNLQINTPEASKQVTVSPIMSPEKAEKSLPTPPTDMLTVVPSTA